MNKATHSFRELFEQLGQPNEAVGNANFLASHI